MYSEHFSPAFEIHGNINGTRHMDCHGRKKIGRETAAHYPTKELNCHLMFLAGFLGICRLQETWWLWALQCCAIDFQCGGVKYVRCS